MKLKIFAVGAILSACTTLQADSVPDAHAPIGVMGDHTHAQGEWMFSYRFMHMSMEDNLVDSSNRSPEEIVSSEANRFANPPMQPPN